MKSLDDKFQQAEELIAGADALVIGAGAGMGVDSGLPDFRGREGFWKAYPALAKAELDFSQVASPATFEADQSLAWGFYGHRLALYRKSVPHAGFDILRQWGEHMTLGNWVFTSNVDGQFQKAGFAEDQVQECHGSIHYLQCLNACGSGVWRVDDFLPEVDLRACRLLNTPPICPRCGELARPNIVMFGDWNWVAQRNRLQRQRQTRWVESITDRAVKVVVVEIGAGTAIPSVRHFSQSFSVELGARIIRINPRESQVPSSLDVGIEVGAFQGLLGIDAALGAFIGNG